MACTNAGCDISVPPNELAHHQEEVCPSRMVVCNSCNLSVKVTDHEVRYIYNNNNNNNNKFMYIIYNTISLWFYRALQFFLNLH